MKRFFTPTVSAILILLAFGICAVVIKTAFLGFTVSSDYETYIETSKIFAGETIDQTLSERIVVPSADLISSGSYDVTPTVADAFAPGDVHANIVKAVSYRSLKPLAPLLTALVHPVLGYERAFWLQSLVFYFAFIVAIYLFAFEFLEDRFLAILISLMAILSYPMLKYGVDILTETGGWFFYTFSLWLTLRFVKQPRTSIFFWNVLIVIVGFLWKEYSAVAAAIFGLVILFHPALSWKVKAIYIAVFTALFAAVNVAWETYIFLAYHYTYLSWYAQGGAPGFLLEFTPVNIVKSIAALLGVGWFAVPFGFRKFKLLESGKQRFLKIALPTPFIALAWGYISSRLLYVVAPPFLALAVFGIKDWKRSSQVLFAVSVIAGNLAWLFLSYSVKL